MENEAKVYVKLDCRQLNSIIVYQRRILKGFSIAAICAGIYIYFSEKKRKELEERISELEVQ
jgi:hypothetical protein